MSTARAWLSEVAALAALFLGTLSPSIWARLYYQNNTVSFVLAMGGAVLGITLLVVWLIARCWKRADAILLLRAGVVGSAALFLGVVVTGGAVSRSPMPALTAAAVAIGAAGYLLFRRFSAEWWPRARQAITVGGALFFFSAPLVGYWASKELNFFGPVTNEARVPTVWLLLDETSFGAAGELVAPLERIGLWTATHALEPAGKNTMDVIPSLVSRRPMGPTTAPCGLTTVCAATHAVDFSRVAVGRTEVDLIGIHHTYCAIRGWRSCLDTRQPRTWFEQWRAMQCWASQRFGASTDACDVTQAQLEMATRERLMAAVLAAPFWSKGGDLYAHLPLPHMPASADPMSSLAAAYESNIRSAAAFVGVVGLRLQQRFPQGFRLIIFSDHPLRPVSVCRAAYGGKCDRPMRYAEPYQVPLIVAAPSPLSFSAPPSNLDVLDLNPVNAD